MRPNDIASRAYVDEIQGRLRDELVAHLDEIDERETSTRRAFEAEMRARVEDSEARALARHAVIARELRVTRMAEVAAQFADVDDDDTNDEIAVSRAARLIALCEAEADAGPYLMTSDREERLLLEVERLRLALDAVLMAADVRESNLVRRIEDVAAEREEWRSRAWAALAGWFTFTFVAGLVVLAATAGVR